jgi:hypothetical protein
MTKKSKDPSDLALEMLDKLLGSVEDMSADELSSTIADAGIDLVAARRRLYERVSEMRSKLWEKNANVSSDITSLLAQLRPHDLSSSDPSLGEKDDAAVRSTRLGDSRAAVMRIVHTSDWHAGRVWKGRDRLPELQNILEHLADFVERERIDLLLMTGDVYESAAPSPEAERAVTTFFKRIGIAGVPAVVIAGNHDSAQRRLCRSRPLAGW